VAEVVMEALQLIEQGARPARLLPHFYPRRPLGRLNKCERVCKCRNSRQPLGQQQRVFHRLAFS